MPHHIDSGNFDRNRWVGVTRFGLFPRAVDRKREEGGGDCCEAVSCSWLYSQPAVLVQGRMVG